MITVVVSPSEFEATELRIEGDAYRHLFRARRLRQQDRLRLVDGAGRARAGAIRDIGPMSATVDLGEPLPTNEPDRVVELFVGVPKLERAGWLVEKATELGVNAVRFLVTERTQRPLGEGPQSRLRRRARAAVEQCHRARVPEIESIESLGSLPQRLAAFDVVELYDVEGQTAPAARAGAERSIALVVGPEGGWTESELESLVGWGARLLTLGPRVLRIETAAVVAASRWLR